jgi:hypothetical protein
VFLAGATWRAVVGGRADLRVGGRGPLFSEKDFGFVTRHFDDLSDAAMRQVDGRPQRVREFRDT